jgi:hypothetical protein
MKPIDLGREGMGGCCPAQPIERNEKHYPSLWLEGGEELDLPASGTMTISFKVMEKTERTDSDGDESYSCRLEVRSIEDISPDETDEPEDTTESDFDKAVTTYTRKTTKD